MANVDADLKSSNDRSTVGKPRAPFAPTTSSRRPISAVFKPIFEKLEAAGVPEARLPSNEHVLSYFVSWVDDKKVDAWVKKYADLMK